MKKVPVHIWIVFLIVTDTFRGYFIPFEAVPFPPKIAIIRKRFIFHEIITYPIGPLNQLGLVSIWAAPPPLRFGGSRYPALLYHRFHRRQELRQASYRCRGGYPAQFIEGFIAQDHNFIQDFHSVLRQRRSSHNAFGQSHSELQCRASARFTQWLDAF